MKHKAKIKVMTIVGTRPEIIRLSRVMALLDQTVHQIVVHTGQNYDKELNDVFWNELSLRKPDYYFNINKKSLGGAIGDIFRSSEQIMLQEKPDAVLVLGDTNSCLSAYIAKRLHIPIFHMEAGNRSFDFNVPEEINRRIIDHIADFNLVYTEHARRHLLSEGLPHRRIYLTGSPMKEVLNYYLPKIKNSTIVNDLGVEVKKYFVVSIHREENVDSAENLEKILILLNKLWSVFKVPVIVSTHPRTRKRLENVNAVSINPNVRFLKPFGFIDYVNLQINALCTISDSGTISEESAVLSFPAISLRQSMERPEAQDTGSIILTGFDEQIVIDSIRVSIDQNAEISRAEIPKEYSIENTSWRVLKLILGNAGLSNKWWGIN